MKTAADIIMKQEVSTNMLILKYSRKDFFGNRVYTEDKKQNYNRDDLKKAFLYFGKNHDISIQINAAVIYWDCMTEYENRVVLYGIETGF